MNGKRIPVLEGKLEIIQYSFPQSALIHRNTMPCPSVNIQKVIEPSLKLMQCILCQSSGKVEKLKVLKTQGHIEKLEEMTKSFFFINLFVIFTSQLQLLSFLTSQSHSPTHSFHTTPSSSTRIQRKATESKTETAPTSIVRGST